MTIEDLIHNHSEELKIDVRRGLVDALETLINSYDAYSAEAKKTDADRKRMERERDELEVTVPGRPTDKPTQILMQIIDHLLYFNGHGVDWSLETPFCKKSFALAFTAELCLTQGLKFTDKDTVIENLKVNYSRYIPGTLEGLPKGYRYNSMLGGPRVIKVSR